MAQSTCTADNCTKPHRARGLCSTHYNQAKGYSKDAPLYARTCDGCGCGLERRARYDGKPVHCSELCRQWANFGAWATVIPRDHISRWVNRTCRVRPARQEHCGWCEAPFITKNQRQEFCQKRCKILKQKRNRKARQLGATGTYTWAQITSLWLAFDKRCAYCAKPTPLTEIQAEHVTALALGGANNLSNLLPSCPPCNSDKRDLSLQAWAADRERRNLPPVATSWDAHDARYRHLVYQHHTGLATPG